LALPLVQRASFGTSPSEWTSISAVISSSTPTITMKRVGPPSSLKPKIQGAAMISTAIKGSKRHAG